MMIGGVMLMARFLARKSEDPAARRGPCMQGQVITPAPAIKRSPVRRLICPLGHETKIVCERRAHPNSHLGFHLGFVAGAAAGSSSRSEPNSASMSARSEP